MGGLGEVLLFAIKAEKGRVGRQRPMIGESDDRKAKTTTTKGTDQEREQSVRALILRVSTQCFATLAGFI
jgi:hypothetical protein